MEVKFNKIIPSVILTIALSLGAVACKGEKENPDSYDPNLDPEPSATLIIKPSD